MDNRLLSLKQAAEIANVSRESIYRMVRDGRIPSIRFGKLYRIKPESLGVARQKEERIPMRPDPPKPVKKPKEETFLDRLRPELENAFRHIPSFGEVGIRVILHYSQVVRVEYSTSVMKKVDLPHRLASSTGT